MSSPKLPDSWRTDDDPTRAAHELHRLVGPDSAFVLYRRKWWVLRFLDPKDKLRRDVAFGELREAHPWQRKSEVLAAGDTLSECVWQLHGGQVRATVGKGFRPQHDASGEWSGFVGPDGTRYSADQFIVRV